MPTIRNHFAARAAANGTRDLILAIDEAAQELHVCLDQEVTDASQAAAAAALVHLAHLAGLFQHAIEEQAERQAARTAANHLN